MDLASRLRQYIDATGMANSEFADRAGIPRPTLSQLLSGRNKSVNDNFIKKIHTAYPALNVSWLLFGEGDMGEVANFEISEPQNEAISGENGEQSVVEQHVAERHELSLFDSDEVPEISNEIKKQKIEEKSVEQAPSQQPLATQMLLRPDSSKKIRHIMVFYTDNSYETFMPANHDESPAL